jgi:hypothetical protein
LLARLLALVAAETIAAETIVAETIVAETIVAETIVPETVDVQRAVPDTRADGPPARRRWRSSRAPHSGHPYQPDG